MRGELAYSTRKTGEKPSGASVEDGVEVLHVLLRHHEERRADMLQVVLAFEDAHRLVDGDAALDHRGVGRRGEDLAAADALIDARACSSRRRP